MKKKNFNFFVSALLALVLAVPGLTSCNIIDDNEIGGDTGGGGGITIGVNADLLGVWYQTNYHSAFTDVYGFEFVADGTCYFNEWDTRDNETPRDGGKLSWSISGDVISIVEEGYDDGEYYRDTDSYRFELSDDKTTLKLYDVDSDKLRYTFIKQ